MVPLVLLSSMPSARPTTVMASPTPATFSSGLIVTSLAVSRPTFLNSTVEKPLSSALTV